MKVLDIFSGIGGFSLGLERAGMETVAFCEIEPYCRKVLKKHWPDVPIYEDVRKLDGNQFRGTVDLVCGGFPCQPFSTAGKRRGQEDDRHLWSEMLRVIREVQPAFVIGENVAGFVSMALDDMLSDLESEGYTCQAFIIPACAINAQHRRDRVWVLATNTEYVRGSEQKREHQRAEEPNGSSPNGLGAWQDVADSNSERLQESIRSRIGSLQKQNESFKRGKSCRGNAEARHSWDVEPGVDRVAHGVSNRVDRIRGLGNAVVPQIPELIGRAIMETIK